MGAELPRRLALLYQEILTRIARLRSGKQPIANTALLRKDVKGALAAAAKQAAALGYSPDDVADASLAVVAFLDESVLTSLDPARAEWAQSTLQEELFGDAQAGQRFFERLTQIWSRPESVQTDDLLEVFGTCLLLGYQGQYARGSMSELYHFTGEIRSRLQRNRGYGSTFQIFADSDQAVEEPLRRRKTRLSGAVLVSACLFMLVFAFAWLQLSMKLSSMREFISAHLMAP